MALEELDELLNSFSEADRTAARELLTRNPNAQSLLTSQQTVYKAFVDGDPAAMQRATGTTSSTQTNPVASAEQPAGVTLDQINALLDERVKSVYTSPDFAAAVETRAKAIADTQLASARSQIIGQGAAIADEIYTIRASHFREFGEELDRAKFEEYYGKEGAKHGNRLTDTYNAYVSDRRIEARVKKGVEEGMAAAQTANVPGSSLPTSNNPMAPNFIDYNAQKLGTTATPSADVDKAAQAFVSMQRGWTN